MFVRLPDLDLRKLRTSLRQLQRFLRKVLPRLRLMISRLSLRLKALRSLLSNFSREDKKVGENSLTFFNS